MFLETIILWIIGISSGLMVSAGVFTVLFVVGLVPRFAGRTETAWCEMFYEECLIAGGILADVVSVYPIKGSIGQILSMFSLAEGLTTKVITTVLLILTGVFSGIFVGCLSIALSEVLDGIPIFARRIRFKKGLSIAVLAIALGKAVGSFIYFALSFFEVAP